MPSSICKNIKKKKHGLSSLVSKPDQNAPHTKGIAFDATVYDNHGKALNGVHFVNASLIKLANQAGLKFINTSKDGVHHQLIDLAPKQPSNGSIQITSISSLKVPYYVNLFSKPSFSSKNYGKIAPQTVHIIKNIGNGWYQISSSVGAVWIFLNPKPLKELKTNKKVTLYSQPWTTSKTNGQIAPQKVKILIDRGDGWYQISTYLGSKWILVR